MFEIATLFTLLDGEIESFLAFNTFWSWDTVHLIWDGLHFVNIRNENEMAVTMVFNPTSSAGRTGMLHIDLIFKQRTDTVQ